MANTLNEMNNTQNPNGRPVDVIPVQIPVVPDRSAVLCINFLLNQIIDEINRKLNAVKR